VIDFKLSRKERIVLADHLKKANTALEVRRIQALLWLDEGESILEIASRLRVTPQTIYNWVSRFRERNSLPISERVADGERSGRPRTAQGIVEPLIEKIIDQDPREFGYQSTIWTVNLLKQYLMARHQIDVSERSISYAIERLDIVWKRPRYALARRAATWRQAKGG
jgi:transposase